MCLRKLKIAICAIACTLGLFASASQFPLFQRPLRAGSLEVHTADYLEPMINIELPYIRSELHSSKNLTVEQIIAAQKGSFARLIHRDFPNNSVRIKRHPPRSEKAHLNDNEGDPEAFCDPTVTSWTGYIDTVDGKSLFFFFFESRSSPDDDPIILWTNGGPGASGALGLFMELGPCRVPYPEIRSGPIIDRTDYFKYSWNDRANMIFIEQPAGEKKAGVGYSYRRFGPRVTTTDQGAVDIYHFLRIFFSAFERFHKNDFHLSGESYGGRYIPRFAAEVADRNQKIHDKARRTRTDVDQDSLINLKSIIVGNGLTDIYDQMLTDHAFACTRRGGYGTPKFDIKTCERIAFWTQRCARTVKESCRDNFEFNSCATEVSACETNLGAEAWIQGGYNIYDISDDCKDGIEVLCYGVTANIARFLDSDDVRELIGAAPRSQIGNYSLVSNKVNADFGRSGDTFIDNKAYVAGLLDRGINALIYAGELDAACHWLGNLEWVQNLDYAGKIDFKKSLRPWYVDGRKVGMKARGGGLTYATVAGAGHMVPYKEEHAKTALSMIRRWTSEEKL